MCFKGIQCFFCCCDRNNNLFSHWDFKQLRKINTNLKHSFKNTRFNLTEQYWQIMIASLVQMMCLIDLRFNSSANYLAIEFVLHAHYAYNEKKIIYAPLSQFEMFTFPDINQLIWKNINHLISKFKSTKKKQTHTKILFKCLARKNHKKFHLSDWIAMNHWLQLWFKHHNLLFWLYKKSHLNKLQHLCSDTGFSNGYKLFKINL